MNQEPTNNFDSSANLLASHAQLLMIRILALGFGVVGATALGLVIGGSYSHRITELYLIVFALLLLASSVGFWRLRKWGVYLLAGLGIFLFVSWMFFGTGGDYEKVLDFFIIPILAVSLALSNWKSFR